MRTDVLERLLDEQEFAQATGVSFRGLTVSETTIGYNIIFRGTRRNGEKVYAMSTHETPLGGLKTLLSVLEGRGGKDYWHRDRFAYKD